MLVAASALVPMLLAATLVAQTPSPTKTEPVIPPVVWELVEIGASNSGPLERLNPERYAVQFQQNGKLAAKADCNQAVGTYGADNGVLEITLSDPTPTPCPSDSHSSLFLEMLDAASDFEMDPDGNLIVRGDHGQLRLRPKLTGVVWEWQDVRGGDDSIVAPTHSEEYTLSFTPAGDLQILAGCVRTLGTYTVNGPSLELSFDGPIGTECDPGSLAERYLRDLDDVSSHVFRDGNLYLALRADAGIMAFVARPAESPATPQTGRVATDPA